MSDYNPLDLTPWANVGSELFDRGDKFFDESWHPPSTGYPLEEQTFRGLPFLIGKAGETHCLVYFGPGGYQQPVEIAINGSPKWLIVAHRLLETQLYTGEAFGKQIATYRFHYADGREVECPIRERLEISVAPPRWGQLPLRSEANQKVVIMTWLRQIRQASVPRLLPQATCLACLPYLRLRRRGGNTGERQETGTIGRREQPQVCNRREQIGVEV